MSRYIETAEELDIAVMLDLKSLGLAFTESLATGRKLRPEEIRRLQAECPEVMAEVVKHPLFW